MGWARAERSRIPNEFAAVTAYYRKHAIRLLASLCKRDEVDGFVVPARTCARAYGVEVRDALIQLWDGVARGQMDEGRSRGYEYPHEESLVPALAADPATPGCWLALSNLGLFEKLGGRNWTYLTGPPEWNGQHPMFITILAEWLKQRGCV